jgi:hypothetical protein
MTTYFYDGQIRRYLLQIIRLMSNFSVRYGDGTLVRIPVIYGDPDRQVANILNQNSDNAVQSAPRIAVYLSELELDTSRIGDSSYVGKVHVRERAYDEETNSYQNVQGNNYTIERLMPTPYKLTIKVDIWTTSNDQKLQVLEQILMLFNPSLEIQTTDNYIDWTSLSVVDLTGVALSSRTVPTGTATDIDIATLTLQTPIWISPPAKVKKLGIITQIISNIFTEKSTPLGGYVEGLGVDPTGNESYPQTQLTSFIVSPGNYDIEVMSDTARLIGFDSEYPSWEHIIKKYTGTYRAGLSKIYITLDNGNKVVGYFSLNPLDDVSISINWDADTYPSNTQLTTNNRASEGTFDAIIDPKKTGPNDPKLPSLAAGSRYLIVDNIGGGIRETVTSEDSIQRINTDVLYNKIVDSYTRVFVDGTPVTFSSPVPNNTETGNYIIVLDTPAPANSEISYELYKNDDGPDAWKNLDGSDFIAEENDVIEWNGNKWSVVFSADENKDQIIYLTNIFTNTQYAWNGVSWGKSFEGVYRKGKWHLEL